MRGTWVTNLILLTLIGALSAVAVFKSKQQEPPKPKLVSDYRRDEINRLVIERSDAVTFEKRGGRWWLIKPLTAPANEFQVERILAIPDAESQAQYPLAGQALAQFGLEQPKAVVHYGDQFTLRFGDSDPLASNRYVQAGDHLHLVGDAFFFFLTTRPTDYIDTKLLPVDSAINAITLPTVTLTRNSTAGWDMVPTQTTSAQGPQQLVEEWQNARAISVQALDSSRSAAAEPVKVILHDKSTMDFLVLQRQPELIIGRQDLAIEYHFTADASERMLQLPPPPAPQTAAPTTTSPETPAPQQ